MQEMMVWLMHNKSKQGLPIKDYQNCSTQNATPVFPTLLRFPVGFHFLSYGIGKQESRKANRPSGANQRILRQLRKYLLRTNSSELHVSSNNSKGLFSY